VSLELIKVPIIFSSFMRISNFSSSLIPNDYAPSSKILIFQHIK